MRRRVNKPFSIPRQRTGTGQSWRRQTGAEGPLQFPASPQPHSNNLIDEKLIEGSQVSSSSSSLFHKPYRQENGTLSYQPGSSTQLPVLSTPIQQDEVFEDENVQLDAFDLELLAQSDGKANNHQQPLISSYHRQVEQPKQVSRFFNGPHVTPHRSIPSSSSDIDTREVSSPLARIQNGRATGGFREPDRNLGGTLGLNQAPQAHSIGVEERYLEPSTDFPTSHHDPSNPFQDIPVSVRGIVLLSVRELPDNYRSLFHFPVFNAVQSKCFQAIYRSDDNVVLAAPTGSGKTVIMELAIFRLLNTLKDEQFKVVYQAPTKSLCSERFRDWSRKFQLLGLQCAELTGDTDHSQLRNVQNSQIIITTPEKWDSMTRKWKDHVRLMQLVKLFLIDEVHTLKEARGATLEAVVSRMKTIGSNVRFVALSATIPNSEDIATWLGSNATSQHFPAHREHFGEEFRPVKLQKFVYGYQSHGNDFAFDKLLNSKLADVIGTHSAKKPIMIFCCTRNSAVTTAKELARLWSTSNHPARLWKGPSKPMPVCNTDLKTTTAAGVAFHHAGLEPADRHQVENGYIEGKISIICCTSTLAVGVNLPCHLVIIKNTVGWQDGCCQEYSDLEVMQMLGRAGRPQFDDTATAVILTRKERVHHYEKLVSGSESLESCLHLNLIDHLNAEIGLGNVTSLDSATAWLAGTFLFVRLRRNPTHYKLKEGANRDDEDEMLRQICEKDIKLLQECDLVASNTLKSTPFGDAMARYYIRFETMKTFLALKSQSGVAEILAAISQAEEFRDVRLKAGEKSVYKEINRSSDLAYPINVDIALPAHKISLLIQSELGAVEFPSNEQFQKHKFTFQQDKNFVFSHVNRLIRCVIDCQVHLGDSVTIRNALELTRSLTAKVWDGSPLQMKQIEQIGVVAVRKLVAAGIDSIEALEDTEPHCIDMALSKNPPFGVKVRGRLAEFPKLRVSVKIMGKDVKPGRFVSVRFKAEIAFMNDKCPSFFQRRPVYVCFIAETSDGRLIDFRRLSAAKLQKNHEISLSGELKQHGQYITCHVMCDEIAGTSRCATLRPDIPKSCFPKQPEHDGEAQQAEGNGEIPITEPCNNESSNKLKRFDTDDLLFGEWLGSEILDDWNDEKAGPQPLVPSKGTVYPKITSQSEGTKSSAATKANASVDRELGKLANGKWACNHKCKDKTSCKHYCCREGLSNPPKVTRKKSDGAYQDAAGSNQLKLSESISKIDPKSVKQQKKVNSQQSSQLKTPSTDNPISLIADSSSDYGDESFDDLPSPSEFFGNAISSLNRDSQKAPGTSKTPQNPLELGDDWIDADEVSFRGRPTLESPSTNYGFAKTCLVDLVSPEPQKLCSMPPQSDGLGGHKRKLTDRSNTTNDDNKRAKNREEPDGIKTDFPRKGEKELTEGNEAENSQMCDVPVVSSIPTGWEGIDPALLDDFKDIIDFF